MYPPKHPDAVVTAALCEHRGNVSAAARSLGQWPKTLWSRVRRNPSLWPEGCDALKAGGLLGAMRRKPAWVPCECCDEFVCTIHGGHVSDCACPPVEEWECDPYAVTPT